LLIVCFLLMAAVLPAHAARLALVIGLDDYDAIPDLRNAAADAQAMGRALRELGYGDVQVVQPRRTLRELQGDIRAFAARVRKGDEVLFFFSGHGVQLGGDNFLLPSDVRAQDDAQVRDDALSLSRVLQSLRELPADRRPAFTLAIIDACRDNPFPSLGKNIGGRGLTGVAGANGQMVVYAAGEGQKALDRLPTDPPGMRNGVFTRVFLERMRQPGVPVPTVLRQVREEVVRLARSIDHDQVPAIYDQVVGDFYFVPPSARPAPGADLEAEAWALCRDGRSALPCQRYLERYATGRFAGLAQTRIEDLQVAVAPSPRPPVQPEPTVPRVGQVLKDCDVCPELVVIGAGSFVMGSPEGEPGRDSDEGPQRRVEIRQSFALGQTEVTQAQWRAVMGTNPSSFKNCDDCPVENVSWNDAQEYIGKLNQRTGNRFGYRLPSEAEWEYAARAGTTTPFWTGQTITTGQANFNGDRTYNGSAKGQYRQRTTPVKTFRANPWGLHDMNGNVWEWVQDVWHVNYEGGPTDGSARQAGGDKGERVLRGGSWYSIPQWLRSAVRGNNSPGNRFDYNGFRLARTVF
jgi:formylglycine-generating enzyme required for sulfatase activity